MKKKINIYGAGISGLTIAFELAKYNKQFQINIYEKEEIVGGMARSIRNNKGISSEHSLRAFGANYNNLFDIMKNIPINKNQTTFDNLIPRHYFKLFYNKSTNDIPHLSFYDKIYIFYLYTKFISSNNRSYYNIKIEPLLKNNLTKFGYDYMVKTLIGPGFGFSISTASIGHSFDLINIRTNSLKNNEKSFSHSTDLANLYFINQPTNEGLIDYWYQFLIDAGVIFHFNTNLTKINYHNNNIINCIINNKELIYADEHIICINPFLIPKIFINSNLFSLAKSYDSLNYINNQIGFKIGFNIKLQVDTHNTPIILIDSSFGIILSQQDSLWNDTVKLDNDNMLKSIWSGCCSDTQTPGKLYNKTLIMLNKNELKEEIISQIFESESLVKYFKNINTNFDVNTIIYFDIFKDFTETNNKKILPQLKSNNPKFVDNVWNQNFKPNNKTNFNNLYISGAHTKTTTNIYLMESACESGKLTANILLNKYNLPISKIYKHNQKNLFTSFLSFFDDILYYFNLYNIIDIILLLLSFVLLLYLKYIITKYVLQYNN